MKPNMFRLGVFATLWLVGEASAAGFGEISLLSRIGEPLRAEIAIVGEDPEIGTACFRLAHIKNSDLPVITAARPRLVRVGEGYRLILVGHKPVFDPAFVIALRADCGVELQRDYVLMPAAPRASDEETEQPIRPPTISREDTRRSVAAYDGDSLETIAESLAAGNPSRQKRLLAGLRRANPELESDTPLEPGTRVRLPERPRRPATPSPQPTRTETAQPPPAPRQPAPSPSSAPPQAAGDRLVLGAPPEEFRPGEKSGSLKAVLPEVEARILKMETTLGLLNQQVDKLNQAVNLATEALALQQQLQMAQALQNPPPTPAPAIPLPAQATPLPQSRTDQWVELLLSALAGGILASYGAHFLSRRRQRETDELPRPIPREPAKAPHLPSAFDTVSAPPVAPPVSFPRAEPSASPSRPLESVDLELDDAPRAQDLDLAISTPPPVSDMVVDESESALQLAEIMLSFGRLRGAADSLATFIEHRAPDRIEPWLMLINLYRRGDMQDEYESLRARLKARFNFRVPEWQLSETPISGLKSLEDYAHIVRRLGQTWGTQSCLDYLTGLVKDDRQGQRAGFPLEVVEEIALLMRLLEDGYGCLRRDAQSLPQAA